MSRESLCRHSGAIVKLAHWALRVGASSPVSDRIKQFKHFFGDDLLSLENDFLRYMRSVN